MRSRNREASWSARYARTLGLALGAWNVRMRFHKTVPLLSELEFSLPGIRPYKQDTPEEAIVPAPEWVIIGVGRCFLSGGSFKA